MGLERVAHCGRQRGGSDDREIEARDVRVHRDLRERGVDRGNCGHRRDPVALDDPPEVPVQGPVAIAERSGPDHVQALEQGPEDGHQQRVRVEERQGGEEGAAGPEQIEAAYHPRVGDFVGVGASGELPGAGRPTGVQVARDVVRCRRRARKRRGVGGGHPLREVGDLRRAERRQRRRRSLRRGRAQGEERIRPRRPRDGAGMLPDDRVQLRPGGDYDARAREADELGGVLGRERRVDRGEDPDRLGRQQQRHQLGAVDRDDRDGVAALDPQVREHVRRPVDVGGQLREGAARRRLPALGVGKHRRRRAVGPQLRRPRHELVGAGRKPASGERDLLDVGQVAGTGERRPEQVARGRGAHG